MLTSATSGNQPQCEAQLHGKVGALLRLSLVRVGYYLVADVLVDETIAADVKDGEAVDPPKKG